MRDLVTNSAPQFGKGDLEICFILDNWFSEGMFSMNFLEKKK